MGNFVVFASDGSFFVGRKHFPAKKPKLPRIRTWGDVEQFVARHSLPYKIVRFNMSLRGVLVCAVTDETCANTVYAAREIVLNTAYEEHKIEVRRG